jgi:hypothetical protein
MSYGEGIWIDRTADGLGNGPVVGSTMKLSPVFQCEVSLEGKSWKATLNGERMGEYSTLIGAKKRLDWECWNRLRQIHDSYRVLMARQDEWKDFPH